ncbi:MurR/RpiR family transcriptional regulator [Williamsoniiplasma luminosum]|uniref:MurR/RpiR family transcriptional regulator n=1 Tax=Williamsoniiplasma luminosum TaxID=214888 RepID=A0A2S0NJ05_9MOLU|nr:hypothetical protein [Williamsoniiplasma luminosum]AVP48993.1 MAG: hypothetical protein C5T88_00090 [Williamsoniiplasma luminosum]
MNEKKLLNLSNLNDVQLDFYNFTLKNIELLLFSTVKEVAEKYGCGISFVYKFFQKIDVTGLKEYIYRLGVNEGFEKKTSLNFVQKDDEDLLKKPNSEAKTISEFLLIDYIKNNEVNFNLIDEQVKKISELCNLINSNERKIYGFGLGHAEICIKELFSALELFGIENIQWEKDKHSDEMIDYSAIKETDVLIIYTFRGVHKYTTKLVEEVRQKHPTLPIYVVTTNRETKLNKYTDHIILINNNARRVDVLDNPILTSIANPFILFNDYLKNYYYLNFIKNINDHKELFKELESLRLGEN